MGGQETDWQLLRDTYEDYGIVLALGAGVSKGAGMPDWIELLTRIETACHGDGGTGLVRWLLRDGYTLPYVATALQESCKSTEVGEAFAELVRAALYRDFPFFYRNLGRDFGSADYAKFVRWIEERNGTLCAVAALCAVARGNPGEYRRNPNIHAIVDFNVDSILREFVEAKYHRRLLRTIERASKDPSLTRIGLYKMHGLLRFESAWKQRTAKEAADKLVFTEGEYFDRFNSPTSLFNYTFLSLLRERSFLFVGLSMQDDNIRRLLHYSTAERKQALAEVVAGDERKRATGRVSQRAGEDAVPDDTEDPAIVEEALRHFAILRREPTPGVDAARERTLRNLGVRVLWVDDYDEIPPQLKKMYETGSGRWDAVYGCVPPA
jgi:hypothetical protein